MRDKTTAGILALVLGWVGGHKFYLGRVGSGLVYLFFCWTGIPAILGLIEGITYLTMSPERFNIEYNPEYQLHNLYQAAGLLPTAPQQPQQPQNIVVSVSNPAGGGTSIADELRKLNELRVEGVISDTEFEMQKQKLLNRG